MNSTAYLKTNAYNKCCTSKLKITKNLTKKAIRFIRRCLWGRENTGQRRGLSKRLDNFRNIIISLIISLFISKLNNFWPYNNKCTICH